MNSKSIAELSLGEEECKQFDFHRKENRQQSIYCGWNLADNAKYLNGSLNNLIKLNSLYYIRSYNFE